MNKYNYICRFCNLEVDPVHGHICEVEDKPDWCCKNNCQKRYDSKKSKGGEK